MTLLKCNYLIFTNLSVCYFHSFCYNFKISGKKMHLFTLSVLISSQTMYYVIVAASIFLFLLRKWCTLTLFEGNKKVIMGVKCHAFRGFFGKNGQMDLAKASETFNMPKCTPGRRAMGLKKMVSPWQHFLAAIFVSTTNEVIIILWQVIFVSSTLNCD